MPRRETDEWKLNHSIFLSFPFLPFFFNILTLIFNMDNHSFFQFQNLFPDFLCHKTKTFPTSTHNHLFNHSSIHPFSIMAKKVRSNKKTKVVQKEQEEEPTPTPAPNSTVLLADDDSSSEDEEPQEQEPAQPFAELNEDATSSEDEDKDEQEPDNDNDTDMITAITTTTTTTTTNTTAAFKSDGKYHNKQRCLIICSRGVTSRFRHLLEDLKTLIPHHKKESKLDASKSDKGGIGGAVNDIAEIRGCNSVLFLECRKRQDAYLWLGHTGKKDGPSAKFLVENIHTMDELRLTGNCMRGSRPVLTFDTAFDSDAKPELKLLKCLFTDVFGTPRGHPKSKPFVDRVMGFYYADGKVS